MILKYIIVIIITAIIVSIISGCDNTSNTFDSFYEYFDVNKEVVFPPTNIVYDIVYWVPMHREVDFNIHFINNVKKFNKNNTFIICLHFNDEQYEIHRNLGVYYNKNILVVPIHYNKGKEGSMVSLVPYLEMFDFMESSGYKYKYCMIVNTSSRFIRQVDIDPSDLIYNISITPNPFKKRINTHSTDVSCFLNHKQCKPLLDFLTEKNMYLIYGYNSGITFTYEFYKMLINYIRINIIPLLQKQENNINNMKGSYPEWLFHTITFYLTGREPFSYGVSKMINVTLYDIIFNNTGNRNWTIEEVKNLLNNHPKVFLIKRVDNINSKTAKYIDNIIS